MKPHFKPDYTSVISQPQCIFKGQKYRITILSDVLVRLEYSDTGYFEDRPTICNLYFLPIFIRKCISYLLFTRHLIYLY